MATATSAVAPSSSASSTAPPAPTEKPQLADVSMASGIVPLTKAEQRESKRQCGSSLSKLHRKVKDTRGRIARTRQLLELLGEPSDIDERCRELLARSTQAYLAATSESAAIMNLKMILVGLSSHLDKTGTLCPDAGPKPDDPAWECMRFSLARGAPGGAAGADGPVFSYRLRSTGKRYTLAATGIPVKGAGATELFISDTFADGKIALGAPVMRRVPRE